MIKIPKKLNICGKSFKIICYPNRSGGGVNYKNYTIWIGTYFKQDIQDILLHEIAEVILLESGFRFNSSAEADNEGYIFVMKHKEFDLFIKSLSQLIKVK